MILIRTRVVSTSAKASHLVQALAAHRAFLKDIPRLPRTASKKIGEYTLPLVFTSLRIELRRFSIHKAERHDYSCRSLKGAFHAQ